MMFISTKKHRLELAAARSERIERYEGSLASKDETISGILRDKRVADALAKTFRDQRDEARAEANANRADAEKYRAKLVRDAQQKAEKRRAKAG